jgi:hypothetical protein
VEKVEDKGRGEDELDGDQGGDVKRGNREEKRENKENVARQKMTNHPAAKELENKLPW